MNNIYNTKSCYSRMALRRSLACFAIVVVSVILHQISFAQSQKSVSEILDENGKIKSGVNGSYNASGYTLDYGESKEPIFKKSNSLQKASVITWSALGSGVDNTVYAVAVSGSDVYVGGYFGTAGGSSANYIAKWNGSAWSALGSGVDNAVRAMAVSGSDVYVGGLFGIAGGNPASRIAKWNGSSWSALGSGVGNTVYAIAVSGSDVYVGGLFTTAGGSSANNIAKWDGSAWSALGVGVDNYVTAIAVSGSDVYVGGGFTTAGGSSANYIAKWNGAWSALGVGVNNYVNAIAISGSDVYVGGGFTTAGGSSANYIAKWNGSAWSALESGVDERVNAIVVSGSDVYVGGYFTTAGGSSANCIAKYGGAWFALGAGTNFAVVAMAVNLNAGAMMVGGGFTTAGGITVNNIAKFTDSNNPLPVELTSFTASSKQNAVELKWNTAAEVNNYGFEIQRSEPLPNHPLIGAGIKGWGRVGFVEGAGTSNATKEYLFTDKNLSAGKYSYRLKQIDRDGKFSYSQSVEVEIGVVPKEFSLLQNYPNPFNPSTVISYQLPVSSNVTLKVFDALGREIAILVNEMKDAGKYEVKFAASQFSSGIYFYRLFAGNVVQMKKMLMIK